MTRNLLFVAVLAGASAAMAQSVAGLWDASVTVNGLEIPFRLELSGSGSSVEGAFFNGDERVTSTSGRLAPEGGLLVTFDYLGAKLEAHWKDGALEGQYTRSGHPYPFRARRSSPPPRPPRTSPRLRACGRSAPRAPKANRPGT